MLDDSCYNYDSRSDQEQEDKSDTEYRIEEEEDDYSEEEEKRNSRKKKRKSTTPSSSSLFKWDQHHEILLLKQFSEFSGDNSSYSKAVFYDYVNNSMMMSNNHHVSLHRDQITKKIDAFKNEYFKNETRRKQNRLDFSRLHQRQVFVLSKRIWGADFHKTNNKIMCKDLKGFMEFLGDMEIDVNCLTLSCLEDLKKDWEVQLLMYIHLLSIKSNFDAKLLQFLIP